MTKYKRVEIYDIDQTIVDSSHRTPNNPDGTLNLLGYLENKNREKIMKDTLLPLSEKMKEDYNSEEAYVIVCTARDMNKDDYDFLHKHDLQFHAMKNRNCFRIKNHDSTDLKTVRKGDPGFSNIYFQNDGIGKENHLRFTWTLKQFKNLPKTLYDDSVLILNHFRNLNIPNFHLVDSKCYTN